MAITPRRRRMNPPREHEPAVHWSTCPEVAVESAHSAGRPGSDSRVSPPASKPSSSCPHDADENSTGGGPLGSRPWALMTLWMSRRARQTSSHIMRPPQPGQGRLLAFLWPLPDSRTILKACGRSRIVVRRDEG